MGAIFLSRLLPCEAANVITQRLADSADDYDKVKDSLLERFRLSSHAFLQKICNLTKKHGSTYSQSAYKLKANLKVRQSGGQRIR